MHVFKDKLDRSWLLVITVLGVKRCRGLLGIDLYALVDENFERLAKLLADPVSLVDVLFVLCQDQARMLGLTDEDFGRSFGGDTLEQAAEAFLAELVDFFPNPRIRAGLTEVIRKGKQLRERILDHAELMLKQVDIDSEARKLIDSFGSSPESSVSIPPLSRSAN